MALGNTPCMTPRSRRADDLIERELGCSHWPGLIGRKRVFISNALELPSFTSPPNFSLAKHHNNTSLVGKSRLESLPEDVLVCCHYFPKRIILLSVLFIHTNLCVWIALPL